MNNINFVNLQSLARSALDLKNRKGYYTPMWSKVRDLPYPALWPTVPPPEARLTVFSPAFYLPHLERFVPGLLFLYIRCSHSCTYFIFISL